MQIIPDLCFHYQDDRFDYSHTILCVKIIAWCKVSWQNNMHWILVQHFHFQKGTWITHSQRLYFDFAEKNSHACPCQMNLQVSSMHPVCLKGKILSGRDQKLEFIFKQAISWFAMKKYNCAKSKASIASVVSIFWSALAFYRNEEIKKDYSFQNKLMSSLNSTLAWVQTGAEFGSVLSKCIFVTGRIASKARV